MNFFKNLKLIALFMITASLHCQEVYVVNNLTQLKIIDLQDFSVTNLFTLGITTSDLAFTADGQLYGVTPDGQLLEIDLTNEAFTIIESFPTGNYTALVANANNELLSSRSETQELFSYNIANGAVNSITTGISTPGDFTFYKGNLIYPNFSSDFIKAFNGSTILNVGCAVNQLFTFVNVFDDCMNETIYGIDNLGRIFNYSIGNEDFEQIAFLGAQTGNVFGGATMTEHLASSCDVLPIDIVTCTLSQGIGNSFTPFKVYPNPTISEVFIQSDLFYGEYWFKLYNVNGTLILKGKVENAKVSTEDLESGVYFIRFFDNNQQTVHTDKLIKK